MRCFRDICWEKTCRHKKKKKKASLIPGKVISVSKPESVCCGQLLLHEETRKTTECVKFFSGVFGARLLETYLKVKTEKVRGRRQKSGKSQIF